MNFKKYKKYIFNIVLIIGLSGVCAVVEAGIHVVGNNVPDDNLVNVDFVGRLVGAACTISAETQNQTVDFGYVTSTAISRGGYDIPFEIVLEGCSVGDGIPGKVSIMFDGERAEVRPDLLRVVGEDSALGISIGYNGSRLDLGSSTYIMDVADENNVLSFDATLESLEGGGAVSFGDFSSMANFVITYE